MPRSKNIRHPSWIDMIKECISVHLPHRGVSRPQIKKYVGETYNLEIGRAQVIQLSKAIISGEKHGIFVLPKGPCGKVELAPKPRLTNASSKETKVVPRPFEFKFRKQRNAYDLSTATEFILLLTDIRNHLLRSRSTRAIYVAMAKNFFFHSKKEVQDICKQPTDEDFLSYVLSNWPTFRSCLDFGEEDSLIWGLVVKGEAQKTNEINIFSELVLLVELSAKAATSSLPAALYKLITTTVVLHELAHAFTKFYFHDNVTPKGVGVGGKRKCGESGWLVEEQMMGGCILAEWTDKQYFGDMFRIDHVLLEKGSERRELDVNVATTSLASLRCAEFIPPVQGSMKKHISPLGSRRGRATGRTDKPKLVPVKHSVGLGIRVPGPYVSYIGEDRR